MLNPSPIKTKVSIKYLSLPLSAAIDTARHARSNATTNILSTVVFLLTAT